MNKDDVEYLLTDDSFARWIQGHANVEEKRKWSLWLKEDPARKYKVQKARKLYRSLKFEEERPNTIQELNRLRNAIANHEKFNNPSKGKSYYLVTAAIITVMLISLPLLAMYVGWPLENEEIHEQRAVSTIQTEYGQIQRLSFPDGSIVILNANSKLTFPSAISDKDVEMKLEGEAYFAVASGKAEEKRTFSVKTLEGTISVLGTRFNVNTRINHTEVVLEEGSVLFETTNKDTSNSSEQHTSYTMSPGEMINISSGDRMIEVKRVNPELYTSWRNLELRFDNTPLWQITKRIEQTYGLEVVFADEELREMRFSGTAPNNNLSILLEGLRKLLDVSVSVEADKITIGE